MRLIFHEYFQQWKTWRLRRFHVDACAASSTIASARAEDARVDTWDRARSRVSASNMRIRAHTRSKKVASIFGVGMQHAVKPAVHAPA